MGLVLDANLVVLLVVGRVDRREIVRHKRLGSYGPDDYDLLLKEIEAAGTLITLPNILTEASNLLRQSSEPARGRFGIALAEMVARAAERYEPSQAAIGNRAYSRLGLTDAAILNAMEPADVLLTADAGLHVEAALNGLRSKNFTHIRVAAFGL